MSHKPYFKFFIFKYCVDQVALIKKTNYNELILQDFLMPSHMARPLAVAILNMQTLEYSLKSLFHYLHQTVKVKFSIYFLSFDIF